MNTWQSALLILSIACLAGCRGTVMDVVDDAGQPGHGGTAGGGSGDADAAPSGGEAQCGNGVVEGDEVCDDSSPECVDCSLSCPTATGLYCGGDGVGGDPGTLYRCVDMRLQVEEHCADACQYMPPGVPDRCGESVGDVPAAVIAALSDTPYVEQNCSPTTYPGWPYEAKHCSYTSGGVYAEVTTATPSPERVGAWIVDSSQEIPALWELRTTDPSAYAQGLVSIARAVMIQSGRIYPLEGDIVENLGDGYYPYHFQDGVTTTCGSGCYCRINSLHRTEWCAWEAHLGVTSYDACIGQVGASGYTDGWGGQCLGNHAAAWQSDRNEHFRARAYRYQQSMGGCSAAGVCSPGDVLSALDSATQ